MDAVEQAVYKLVLRSHTGDDGPTQTIGAPLFTSCIEKFFKREAKKCYLVQAQNGTTRQDISQESKGSQTIIIEEHLRHVSEVLTGRIRREEQ